MNYKDARRFKHKAADTNRRLVNQRTTAWPDIRQILADNSIRQFNSDVDRQWLRNITVSYMGDQMHQNAINWYTDAAQPAQITFEHFQAARNLPYSQ